MRVATFNVQRGTPSAGAREAGLSAGDALEAAATELSELGLDVLALQEVDEPLRGLAPSAYRSLSAASNLANRRFAPARRLLTAFAAALRGRRRSGYGIALATRLPVLSWKVLRLPSWKSPIRRDLSGERGVAGRYIRFEEQRMAIVAALDAPPIWRRIRPSTPANWPGWSAACRGSPGVAAFAGLRSSCSGISTWTWRRCAGRADSAFWLRA